MDPWSLSKSRFDNMTLKYLQTTKLLNIPISLVNCVEASCSHKLHTLYPAYRRDYVEGQTLDSK